MQPMGDLGAYKGLNAAHVFWPNKGSSPTGSSGCTALSSFSFNFADLLVDIEDGHSQQPYFSQGATKASASCVMDSRMFHRVWVRSPIPLPLSQLKTTTIPEATSTMMDVLLPEHLLYEILLFLPVKSLLTFRTLSRHWCDIISSHDFAVDHLIRSCKSGKQSHYYAISYSCAASSITMYPETGKPFQLDLPKIFKECGGCKGEFSIQSSCHGLLCVTLSVSSSRYVMLWNPVTRECRELADCVETFGSVVKFALGFDTATNDYKVVKMTSSRDMCRPNRKIAVSSLKYHSVTIIEDETQYLPSQRAVSVDGYIFWLAMGLQHARAVLKFDLARDYLTPIPIPPEATTKSSPHERISLSIHECNGSVRLVRFESQDEILWNIKHIWLLSTADETWKDISSCYEATLGKSFRGWDGPLGLTSDAAVVIERRADCVRGKEDGVERIGVGGTLKDDPNHFLLWDSLVSPWW